MLQCRWPPRGCEPVRICLFESVFLFEIEANVHMYFEIFFFPEVRRFATKVPTHLIETLICLFVHLTFLFSLHSSIMYTHV